MKRMIFVLCFLCSSFSFGQEQVPYPLQDGPKQTIIPEIPEDLKGLVWNKWSTNNFIIISIDKSQGLYLKNNLEDIKSNLIKSWGIKDINFKGECKIVCVSNDKLLKRIFRLENSKFEFRKNENGEINCVIWFSLENTSDLPVAEFMQLCISQLEIHNNDVFPLFCKRGMSVLSQNFEDSSSKLLGKNIEKISFKDIFSKKEQDVVDWNDFDIKSSVACLLLRKEYGQDNFLNFLNSKKLEEFGIINSEKFDEIINRYYRNLIDDLKNNKTPKDYLQIQNSRR
jgi:hypothetical protein